MLAAVAVVVVVLAVVTAAATVGRPVRAQEASAAMSYVPASGGVVVLQNSDGTDTVAEYYSTFGAQIWQSGPVAFGYGATFEELSTGTWVRIAEVTADAGGRSQTRGTRLLAARQSGLEVRAQVRDAGFQAFEPGLPILPAGVRDGQQWTAAGVASVGTGRTVSGRQPYAASFSARGADDGCIVISSELTLGGKRTPARESATWCPGRGVVATETGGRAGTAVNRAPRWQSLGRVVAADPPDLTGAWSFVHRNLQTPPLALNALVRPAVLPGPVVVYVNTPGGDLVARGWSDAQTDARWSAHPGGQVVAVEAIGRVVVATTSTRIVAAYGDQGEFLWQATLDDVTALPIVRFGGQAVIAGLDGTVTAFDAETGRIAWKVQTPTEIRRPMVTDGRTLSVLDQAGNLVTVGADGAVLHAFETVPPEAFAVADGIAVVASRGDSYVRGYRLVDGEQLWRTHVPGGRRSMDAVGPNVVIGGTDSLVGVRAADGVPSWTKPITPVRTAVQDDRLIVADRTTLRLLDAAGTELEAFQTQEQDLDFGAGAFLVAGSGELFCFFSQHAYRKERR